MENTPPAVTFLASMAPGINALRYSGDCDGQRLVLDIPETEIGNAAGLLAMRRRRLRVTVEVLDDEAPSDPPKPPESYF